jgi:hypothetical protein
MSGLRTLKVELDVTTLNAVKALAAANGLYQYELVDYAVKSLLAAAAGAPLPPLMGKTAIQLGSALRGKYAQGTEG